MERIFEHLDGGATATDHSGLEPLMHEAYEELSRLGGRDRAARRQDRPPQREPDVIDFDDTIDGRNLFNLSPDRAAEIRWRDDIRADRQTLDRFVDQIPDLATRERVRQRMDDFERRAQSRYLDSAEVRDTYRSVSRLLEDPQHTSILSQEERRDIAMEVLYQAAHPEHINQGQHNTCNVATVEARAYTLHPSAAARLVTDVALTGQYRSTQGTTVTLPGTELKPDNDALSARANPEVTRSHASQLFQQTAVNLYYATHTFEGHQVRYQVSPESGTEHLVGVHGEILYDAPSLHARELLGISNEITGQRESASDLVITHESGGEEGTIQVSSESDLRSRLDQMRSAGRFPAIILVHSGNEPFYSDSNAGAAGGSGDWHVVTITDYDAAGGMVTIDNQWGRGADHAVDVRQLYLATQHPMISANTLEQDAEWNRTHANTEQRGWAELEALRIRNATGQLADAQYHQSIVNTMRRLENVWQRHERTGDLDSGARDRARERYQLLFNQILARDPQSAANIDRQVRAAGPRPVLYA